MGPPPKPRVARAVGQALTAAAADVPLVISNPACLYGRSRARICRLLLGLFRPSFLVAVDLEEGVGCMFRGNLNLFGGGPLRRVEKLPLETVAPIIPTELLRVW